MTADVQGPERLAALQELGRKAAARMVSGLSNDTVARIACWHHVQPCGHPDTEHRAAVQALLEAGWDGGEDFNSWLLARVSLPDSGDAPRPEQQEKTI